MSPDLGSTGPDDLLCEANRARAKRADHALRAYCTQSGQCLDIAPTDCLTDLLCDLMHWANQVGVKFTTASGRASGHYLHELDGSD